MDKLLLKLINSFGISGKEDEIRQVIKETLNEVDYDVSEDSIGNIFVKVGIGKTKVMICSNMDSVGFIVNDIEEDGMIKVSNIGEFNTQDISHSFIRFHNGTLGKVCTSSKGADGRGGILRQVGIFVSRRKGRFIALDPGGISFLQV